MTYTTTSTWNYIAFPGFPACNDPDVIICDVCDALKIERSLLDGKSRETRVKFARWLVWKILHKKGYTLKQCGDLFGKDHSSVHHGLEKIDRDIKAIPYLREAWNKVKIHYTDKKEKPNG